MTAHEIRTSFDLPDHQATADLLTQLVLYWFKTFEDPEKLQAIPATRAEWTTTLAVVVERTDGERQALARNLHDLLGMMPDFSITLADDGSGSVVIEYSTPIRLTLTPQEIPEEDRPTIN